VAAAAGSAIGGGSGVGNATSALSAVAAAAVSGALDLDASMPTGDLASQLAAVASGEFAAQSDSLPIGVEPLPSALKVETNTCFTSLVSRPVAAVQAATAETPSSRLAATPTSPSTPPAACVPPGLPPGRHTPAKRASLGGNDRAAFYKLFTATYKSKQLTEMTKSATRGASARDGRSQSPNPSSTSKPAAHAAETAATAVRYENKTNDLIWLELQAWFANMAPTDYDKRLVEMREDVGDTISRILTFSFLADERRRTPSGGGGVEAIKAPERGISVFSDRSDPTTDISSASEQFYDAQETLASSVPDEQNAFPTSSPCPPVVPSILDPKLDDFKVCSEPIPLKDSLDVFHLERVTLTNAALERVSSLIDRLEEIEALYASGKMFRIDHPAVGNPEFQARVACLCMWYNLTK